VTLPVPSQGKSPAFPPAQGPSTGLDPFGRQSDESLDWRRYAQAVRRYRWLIVGLALVGIAGGMLANRLLPPRYEVQATLWIQTEPRAAAPNRGPIGGEQLLPPAASVDLLKSFVVLDDVVRERRRYLITDPKYAKALESFSMAEEYRPGSYQLDIDRTGRTYRLNAVKGPELEHGAIGDSIGRSLGFRWAPPAAVLPAGGEVTFTLRSIRDAASGLAAGLNAAIDQSGNFLRVSMTSVNPNGAAATVNAVVRRYVDVATELKRAKLTELSRLLSEQLEAAAANLRTAETALATFGSRTITLAPDIGQGQAPQTGNTTTGPLSGTTPRGDFYGMKIEGDQLARDAVAINQVLGQARDSSGGIDGLALIGAVQRSPDLSQALKELTTKRAELRALQERYTDEHPLVQRARTDLQLLERQTIPQLARGLVTQINNRQAVLAPQIASGGRQLQAVPQRAVVDARLRRDVEIAATLYTGVQQRYNEARLAEASSTADVRILDLAVPPQSPIGNAGRRLLILGLIAGLALGVLGAVVLDHFDPRVRNLNQVIHELGLPILGALPHVKNKNAGAEDPQVALMQDAMRTIRLNVVHAHGSAGPLLVTVTSPGIGDGKSFVSRNLAIACAQSGQRTILIDGDARRGVLNRALRVQRKPGLTDFLSDKTPFESVLQATSYPGLHFVGAGSRLRESPELLGSQRMVELVMRVRGGYDAIIIDSPPLGAGVDACTLGTLTGSMVLVLRTGATNLDIARMHLTMLSRLPIRLLGVVLNDVQPGGMYGYYYLAGYGTSEEGLGEGSEVELEVEDGVVASRQRIPATPSTP
jgi:capsular exopolysaccharide synthesis family protein